jgi:hypothetical protein
MTPDLETVGRGHRATLFRLRGRSPAPASNRGVFVSAMAASDQGMRQAILTGFADRTIVVCNIDRYPFLRLGE